MLEQLVGQALGRYQLDQLLGEGGMGAVFKAHDPTLGRAVALKVMLPNLAQQPGFRERFLQEARVAAQLKHAGIVQVHDFGQAGEHLFIVMAFVPGDNLYQLLHRLKANDQWLELSEAVRLVRQICLALDYAHRQGVLHRDIKPSNIMLEPEAVEGLPYRPVITDLGLAKLLEGGLMTMSGVSLGTPAYMSPEAAQGEGTDARSDVYSLGVLLYELTVGQLPFPIKTLTQALRYHTKEVPPPPRSLRSDLPAALEQVILKALAKAADDRFATAAALAQALEQILPTLAPPTASPTVRASHVSLLTHYQQSLVAPRGSSILEEIPTPSDLSHDSISVLTPEGAIHTQPLTGRTLTIGRNADNDVVLDDDKASRHHVRIECDGQTYKIFDLDSRNGTFLANVKLLPGVPEVWPPNKALRIGKHWLRLTQAQAPATPSSKLSAMSKLDLTKFQTSMGGAHIGLFLAQTEFTVEPGGSVAIPLVALNQGPIVDHFIVSAEGIPTHWVPTLPPLLQLMPGEQQEIALTLQPPRTPQSRAGPYPLTVKVSSQHAPAEVVNVACRLTLTPYYQFTLDLRPQKQRSLSEGNFTLQLANQSNVDLPVQLEARDPEDACSFTFEPAQPVVPAGETKTVRLTIQAKAPSRRNEPRSYTFTITARTATTAGLTPTVQGEWVQVPAIFTLALQPPQQSGTTTADFTVRVRNDGECDLALQLEAADPAGACVYKFSPAQLPVSVGTEQTAELEVSNKASNTRKASQSHHFTVRTYPLGTPALAKQVEGEWTQLGPTAPSKRASIVGEPKSERPTLPAKEFELRPQGKPRSKKGCVWTILLASLAVIAYVVYMNSSQPVTPPPDVQPPVYNGNNQDTNPQPMDTDGDGLQDSDEISLGTDPKSADTDGDGLQDGDELRQSTNPQSADTDGDGLTDNVDPDPLHKSVDNPPILANHTYEPTNPTTSDIIRFFAEATDDIGLAYMQVLIDGQIATECTSPPSPCEYSGGPYLAGALSYQILACDNANQCTSDSPLQLVVAEKYLMDNDPNRVILVTQLSSDQYRIEEQTSPWPWEGTATIASGYLNGLAKFSGQTSMNVEGIIRDDGSIIIKYRFINDEDGNPLTRVDEHVWYPSALSSQLQKYLMDNDSGRTIFVKSLSGDQYRIEEPSSPWPWEGTATIANGILSGEAKFRNGATRMRVLGEYQSDGSITIKYDFINDENGNPITRVDEHIWYPVSRGGW